MTDRGQVGAWNGKSIPTFYNGHTFRSRTEARWAVFMDQLGVRWFYEHEGFQLPSGWYVPDFLVPELDAYLEIKGPEQEWSDRCYELAHVTKKRVVLFVGTPSEQSDFFQQDGNGGYVHDSGEDGEPYGDDFYLWCTCPSCGKIGIQYAGRGARVCGNRCLPDSDKGYSGGDTRISSAKETALAWRFH